MTVQEAYLIGEDGFPKQFDLILQKDQPELLPGDYVFAKDAVYLDRNNKLAIAPRLQSVSRPNAIQAATGGK